MAVIIAKGRHGVLTGTVFVDDQAGVKTRELVAEATHIPIGDILETDGTLYRQEDYPDLYAVIGRQYGGGPSTFRVPQCSSWADFQEAGNGDIKSPEQWKQQIKNSNRR